MRRRITDSKAGGVGRIMGGAVAAVFAIFWMVMAAKIGAPTPFVLFGLVMVVGGIVHVIIGPHNVSAPPADRIGGTEIVDLPDGGAQSGSFCDQCGATVLPTSRFCPKCGSRIRRS